MADMVNHPEHYNQNGVETIDIIEAALTPEEFRGFLKGNVMKYLDRHEFKNGEQDLKKAQWYAQRFFIENTMEEIKKSFDCNHPMIEDVMLHTYFIDQPKQSAIKHWEEYRNELSKNL